MTNDCEDITNQDYRKIMSERWLEYLHALGTVEGNLKCNYTRNSQPDGRYSMEIVCNYPLLVKIHCDSNEFYSVHVFGERYNFMLGREGSDNEWFVDRLSTNKDVKTLKSWGFPLALDESKRHLTSDDIAGYEIFNTLGVGLFMGGSTPNLWDVFQNKHLIIKKIEYIKQDKKNQIFIDFDCTIDNTDVETSEVWTHSLQGQIWLESNYYLISKAKIKRKVRADEEYNVFECEYDYDTYRVPLPKKYKALCDYDYKNDNIKGVMGTNIDFDLHETDVKDKTRFTLSAYGIPDPDAPRPALLQSRC